MGIVYVPEPKREPIRPRVSPTEYAPGTMWESEDGTRWIIEWDDQDHRYWWFQTDQPVPGPTERSQDDRRAAARELRDVGRDLGDTGSTGEETAMSAPYYRDEPVPDPDPAPPGWRSAPTEAEPDHIERVAHSQALTPAVAIDALRRLHSPEMAEPPVVGEWCRECNGELIASVTGAVVGEWPCSTAALLDHVIATTPTGEEQRRETFDAMRAVDDEIDADGVEP